MTTAQEIFEAAMALMDELNEATGAADTNDTKEYKNRTLPILNTLRIELYPYSDTFKQKKAGKRPVPPKIEDFDSAIMLDDSICQSAMVYGLAFHLLETEDPEQAAVWQSRYERSRVELMHGLPAESEDIEDVYGGIGYGEFARW